ncbi:MAG: RluA family pseudouridine synthase [Bdellovibrionales bacterium]|nr:RluA family pseudouridine synthase [Bdellovibrionales bacterium]
MSDTTKTLSGKQYRVTHSVGPNQSGIRLDRFLMDRYTRRSREKLKRIIDSGAIRVIRENSKHRKLGRIKASFSLQAGDIVELISIKKPEPEVSFDYKILYEDQDILVLNKPPNLPVHPAGRFFFNTLLTHLKTDGFKLELERERNFFLVHRIDKETSGILLLAKSKDACNALTLQFRNRETEKYYLSILRGKPESSRFKIETPIGKPRGAIIGIKMEPLSLEAGGLASETLFETIETREGKEGTFTLSACFPKTGRQHQIRVHAEIAGHPLVGDKVYGMSEEDVLILLEGNKEVAREESEEAGMPDEGTLIGEQKLDLDLDDFEAIEKETTKSSRYRELEAGLLLKRHALHAAGLRFRHPSTGKFMEFECDLPDDLREFFESLTGERIRPFRTKHW